jgi:hypothetical protein
MTVLRNASAVGACLLILSCGSSEPSSPLILGANPADTAPGPRALTASQTRALQDVITSAGEPCEAISRAHLRDVDVVAGAEAWDVRCSQGSYAVVIRADGTPSAVRRCISLYGENAPCVQPYAGRPGRRAPGGPLNPELGKLLEPMTAKDGKSD